MGTRGFMGFVVDGELKGQYNHFDSYPAGLGEDVLDWISAVDEDTARQSVKNLAVISDEDAVPTQADFERFGAYWQNVSAGQDWYSLLRNCQGNPDEVLASGVILDGTNFPADSVFCEWGYVVDFDNRVLEVYKGFQKAPHDLGRFASMENNDPRYYPIALVGTFSFDELPEDMPSFRDDEDDE